MKNKLNSKKVNKKFNKNSSFSGVAASKSPESRRKSIATVLPTLKKKKGRSIGEWTVSDTSIIKRTQLIVTDDSEKLIDVVVNTSTPLKTPKSKKKKSKDTSIAIKEKLVEETASPSAVVDVSNKKKKQKERLEGKLDINDYEKFGIKAHEVSKVIEGAIKLHRENPKLQNQLLNESIPLFLHISCHNVPNGPYRIIRVPLPNSLLSPDDEVCLIVPEVKGIKNIEYEKHIEHYEDLLRRKGVNNIKKVMTFHQFRTEYETFEQKNRLADLYDRFLVDGRLSGKVVNKCGKIFYKKRKVPTAVKLQATKLKEQIDNALSKTFFMLHLKGDYYSVQFGHDKMETQDLVDNVFAVIETLDKEFPGGFNNLKGIYISALRSTSLPIYSSFKNPQEVKVPKIKPKRPKAFKTYEDELTTLLNADVIVEPSGNVIVKRTEIEEENESKNMEEDEETEDKSEKKVKKSKKRKHSNVVSSKNVNEEDIDNNENIVENDTVVEESDVGEEIKVKKTKKRKQSEVVKEQISVAKTEENSNTIKKKKKIKGNVTLKTDPQVNVKENIENKKPKGDKKKIHNGVNQVVNTFANVNKKINKKKKVKKIFLS